MNIQHIKSLVHITLVLMLCSCSTNLMKKDDLIQVFTKCSNKTIITYDKNGNCKSYFDNGADTSIGISCSLDIFDPLTQKHLIENGKVVQYSLPPGTIIPIVDENGVERSLSIDQNTELILNPGGDNEVKTYLTSTWLVDGYIVGYRSRILGWGKYIHNSKIESINIYTEFTGKQDNINSCIYP